MLLVKPVTVSRGFSVVVGEEQERLTTDLQTEMRQFFIYFILSVLSVDFCKNFASIFSSPNCQIIEIQPDFGKWIECLSIHCVDIFRLQRLQQVESD